MLCIYIRSEIYMYPALSDLYVTVVTRRGIEPRPRLVIVMNNVLLMKLNEGCLMPPLGGRRSPAVACWASDHWVASSNPLRDKFRH